ncbi:hypothetical protein BY996DRAFT_7351121 [Phakopsora pachyrhizi]|nr:hypothetical protein BY996DRAFT_7351121 [Phakopsora pachyrhizi]
MARDFGSNSGHISTNINKENLDHSNIMKNFPFTSPEEVPSHFYSKSLNQIHGGILPEEGFSSLPEHSEDFNQCSDQGHNLYASNIYGNHDHQVHDKNLPSSVSGHHNKNYYNHIQQALSSCLDTNQANSINYNYGTYNHQNIENIENVILENIGQSIQHQTSDHSNLSCKNGLNINVDEDKGQYLMKADENEQNFENILQKKQRLTENLSFQPVKKLNTIENFTGKIHPNQSISKSKKLAVGFKHNEYKLKLDQKTRANVELNTKETLQDMENFINDLSKDHQQQDSLKLRIPDKFLPILIELENFLQKFPKPPKVKNESQFINKALLYMKWERKPEIINYALEYFFSISKIPCMSSKESFLKAVFDKQKKVFKKKAKKHPIFAVARTFYAKQMRPIDFILKIDNRWTFATVLAEIQAHLGLRLLMDSGLSSLPQKETKALKLTYENIIKKSAEKMTEVKLNQIVDNAVYSLILNIYQIDIIKQTATYFDKDIGIEDDIEKNWNLLASNWHNIESLNQVKPDPKTKGKIKKCDETNSEDLHSLLKRKMGMRSVSGKENMLNNISSINFEIWFKNNLYNTEWLTKYEKTCFSNLHLFMKHFSVADWLGRMKNL